MITPTLFREYPYMCANWLKISHICNKLITNVNLVTRLAFCL